VTFGSPQHPLLIAEIGVNHDGLLERAIALIHGAAAAGFDAVKFQYWIESELLAPTAPNAGYQGGGDQHELLRSLALDLGQLAILCDEAHRADVQFICTGDGPLACAELATLELDALKVGSGDMDNPEVLDAAASTGLPLLVSTGMGDDAQVQIVADHLRATRELVFLHCVSAYPTPLHSANVARVAALRVLTERPSGFSDHTLGIAAAAASVAFGATVIEKHVTWSPEAAGPDHAASLAVEKSSEWTSTIRELAEGIHTPRPSDDEVENARVIRKGLYPTRALPAGHRLGSGDLRPLRPRLDGIPALQMRALLGRVLTAPVSPANPLTWRDVDGSGE
jgi:N,N'-diacetyllegionaminate synthase